MGNAVLRLLGAAGAAIPLSIPMFLLLTTVVDVRRGEVDVYVAASWVLSFVLMLVILPKDLRKRSAADSQPVP
jgi:hypothetical protein